jgi:hypothetical protein
VRSAPNSSTQAGINDAVAIFILAAPLPLRRHGRNPSGLLGRDHKGPLTDEPAHIPRIALSYSRYVLAIGASAREPAT